MIDRFSVVLLSIVSILGGCLAGGNSTEDTVATVNSQITTADFFHLAVVPYQAVTTSTFDIQVIAENLNLNSQPSAPIVTDASGGKHTMQLKWLQWPGTAQNSVQIYSSLVPLINGLNNITVTSGTKQIQFPVTRKSSLNIQTATNATDLQNKIKAAIADATVDVIEIGYPEGDLGAVIDNVGNGIINARSTWLAIRPATGQSVSWLRDYPVAPGAPSAPKHPRVNYLNLNSIVFGSDTSDGGAYQLYVEPSHYTWLSDVQFRGKYKVAWAATTPMTPVDYVSDVRGSLTEGQKIYYTDCLWDGTAGSATLGAELARDLRFNSHRADFDNFAKVFLNAVAQDINTVTINANTDVLHNDGFQIWSNIGTTDLVFKGFKVTSPNVAANLQPITFDKTSTPTNYSGVLIDSVSVTGAPPGSVERQFFAGNLSNSRISNVSLDQQFVVFRQDFTSPSDPFAPVNVYIQNYDTKGYLYCAPGQVSCTGGTNYSIANGYSSPVTSQLSAISGLSGITFSNMLLH